MRGLPDKSFDVIVADPPYNIGKAEWDKWPSVEAYVADVMTWLREFSRLLKDTGSLWMFHSDMAQFSRILAQSQHEPGLILRDFVVLYKRNFRAKSWRTAECAANSGLRSLFNVNEYLAHWFACPRDGLGDATGLERIYSNPGCFKPIKEWYTAQCEALGLTAKDIASKYTEVTGKKPHMLRHYFQDSQFEIPTEAVWRTVYEPLGFSSMVSCASPMVSCASPMRSCASPTRSCAITGAVTITTATSGSRQTLLRTPRAGTRRKSRRRCTAGY